MTNDRDLEGGPRSDHPDRFALASQGVLPGEPTARIPGGAPLSPDAAFEDEHVAARGFNVPVRHPELGGTITYPGTPYVFSDAPTSTLTRPPCRRTQWLLDDVEPPHELRSSTHPHRSMCQRHWTVNQILLRCFRIRRGQPDDVEAPESARLLEVPGLALDLVYLQRTAFGWSCWIRGAGGFGNGEPRPMNALGFTHLSFRVDDPEALIAWIERSGGGTTRTDGDIRRRQSRADG